jgi:BirA family biotin operon repressor/biotin-[acetyl-CoA-carboxylase] ligase
LKFEKILFFDTLDSTNLYASKHFEELDGGTAIFAKMQTSGKGRFDRKWLSPQGNIYASFIIKKYPLNPVCAAFSTCIAGLQTLRKIADLPDLSIKLPNDIVCENRKFGGVLCENRKLSSGENGIIAGIGLNINSTEEELKDTGNNASSLFIATGKKYDLKKVSSELIKNIQLCLAMGENEIISSLVANCRLMGCQIAVRDGGKKTEGVLKNILSDGAAVIEFSDGSIKKFYSGDFFAV